MGNKCQNDCQETAETFQRTSLLAQNATSGCASVLPVLADLMVDSLDLYGLPGAAPSDLKPLKVTFRTAVC